MLYEHFTSYFLTQHKMVGCNREGGRIAHPSAQPLMHALQYTLDLPHPLVQLLVRECYRSTRSDGGGKLYAAPQALEIATCRINKPHPLHTQHYSTPHPLIYYTTPTYILITHPIHSQLSVHLTVTTPFHLLATPTYITSMH